MTNETFTQRIDASKKLYKTAILSMPVVAQLQGREL